MPDLALPVRTVGAAVENLVKVSTFFFLFVPFFVKKIVLMMSFTFDW